MDQTGINGEALAAHQPFADAALQYGLEQPPKAVIVAIAIKPLGLP
jgi:hypothetical protein